MQLTDVQKQKVSEWIAEGLRLSDIQNRLGSEFDLRLTYMDVRLLVDDLKLTPKETEQPAPAKPAEDSGRPEAGGLSEADEDADFVVEPPLPKGKGGVSLSVDQLTRAGALVSGKVTFSDGQKAEWYLDQMGRLGMVPSSPGYRPPQADVAEFQLALEKELIKLGF